jgi:hypothetical protein
VTTSSGENLDSVLSTQTGSVIQLPSSSQDVRLNKLIERPGVTRHQLKIEKGDSIQLPWLNSEKFHLVKLKWENGEVRSSGEPVVMAEGVIIDGDSYVTHVFVYSTCTHTLPYILAMINNTAEQMFVDTGSSLNLASFEAYSDEHMLPIDNVQLTSASGHNIALEGKITLNVMLGNITLPVEFVLIKGLEMKLLLGNSLFRQYDFKMNYQDKLCEFFYNGKSSGPLSLLQLDSPATTNPVRGVK